MSEIKPIGDRADLVQTPGKNLRIILIYGTLKRIDIGRANSIFSPLKL